MLTSAFMKRLVLALNHVLAGEPVATRRLQSHVGRTVQLSLRDWPRLLPPMPATCFRITPAGLLEWCGDDVPATPDLRVTIDASNPVLLLARSVAGDRPSVDVQGDAGLAADVSWLFDNLRWDVREDLSQLVGPAQAERLAGFGSLLASGLRSALSLVSARAERRAG